MNKRATLLASGVWTNRYRRAGAIVTSSGRKPRHGSTPALCGGWRIPSSWRWPPTNRWNEATMGRGQSLRGWRRAPACRSAKFLRNVCRRRRQCGPGSIRTALLAVFERWDGSATGSGKDRAWNGVIDAENDQLWAVYSRSVPGSGRENALLTFGVRVFLVQGTEAIFSQWLYSTPRTGKSGNTGHVA